MASLRSNRTRAISAVAGVLAALLLVTTAMAGRASTPPITYQAAGLAFRWDPARDEARVTRVSNQAVVWTGSLLPSFWLQAGRRKEYVKATLTSTEKGDSGAQQLNLQIGGLGKGRLVVTTTDWGIRFVSLEIDWLGAPPALIEMYFGASSVALETASVWPTWDRPFMPDWQSFGFCVPGAKEGPGQSYFRSWDFGQANIALGNFGPSTGSPYGAAYPKPLFYAGMGSDDGFVALGAGSLPDAAMSLRIQSARGCLQYVYDEDLWGALPGRKRTWTDPLRICLGADAWTAFRNYYRSFPVKEAHAVPAPKAFFDTWGLWRDKRYEISPVADFGRAIGASMLLLDDGWQQSEGAGVIHSQRWPDLDRQLAAVRDSGMFVGLWEVLGWVEDTAAAGLRSTDLILNRYGKPCKANWNFDPASPSFYCLDISSARAREFLRQRTIREMNLFRPALIKLDFGYALPDPSMGVPRDPRYRGERASMEMIRLIAAAARSVDPSVVIMYYGIGPLALTDVDMVSLDDQGDLWYDLGRGHREWSIWASLVADRQVGLTGSSGYDWAPDDEVILNTAVIGSPGASLPSSQPGGLPVAGRDINRRLAIDKWFRRTVSWAPLWLNSCTGNFDGPPGLRCWGRLEGKDSILTALALRPTEKAPDDTSAGMDSLPGPSRPTNLARLRWTGRWALISQDDKDLFSTSSLALIPFDAGELSLSYPEKPAKVSRLGMAGESAYTQWSWDNGRLTISVTEGLLDQTAGFLIDR